MSVQKSLKDLGDQLNKINKELDKTKGSKKKDVKEVASVMTKGAARRQEGGARRQEVGEGGTRVNHVGPHLDIHSGGAKGTLRRSGLVSYFQTLSSLALVVPIYGLAAALCRGVIKYPFSNTYL